MAACDAAALCGPAAAAARPLARRGGGEEDIIQVFLHMEGQVTVLRVDSDADVAQLRASAARRIGAEPGHVSLTASGRLLSDNYTLSESGVANLATVFVSLRLRGGQMFDMTTIIGFVIIGIVIIVAVYYICKYVILSILWIWTNVLEWPTTLTYNWAIIPSGKAMRQAIFRCKEGCCGLCSCCDTRFNPWKRMDVV